MGVDALTEALGGFVIVSTGVGIVGDLLRGACENFKKEASPMQLHHLSTALCLPPLVVFIEQYWRRHEIAMELDFVDKDLHELI